MNNFPLLEIAVNNMARAKIINRANFLEKRTLSKTDTQSPSSNNNFKDRNTAKFGYIAQIQSMHRSKKKQESGKNSQIDDFTRVALDMSFEASSTASEASYTQSEIR